MSNIMAYVEDLDDEGRNHDQQAQIQRVAQTCTSSIIANLSTCTTCIPTGHTTSRICWTQANTKGQECTYVLQLGAGAEEKKCVHQEQWFGVSKNPRQPEQAPLLQTWPDAQQSLPHIMPLQVSRWIRMNLLTVSRVHTCIEVEELFRRNNNGKNVVMCYKFTRTCTSAIGADLSTVTARIATCGPPAKHWCIGLGNSLSFYRTRTYYTVGRELWKDEGQTVR